MAVEDIREIERTYPPEDAGQRVGWVSVESKSVTVQTGEQIEQVDVNVAIATIGENGARLGYTRREHEDGVRHYSFPENKATGRPADTEGFIAVTGLSVRILQNEPIRHDPPYMGGNIERYVERGPHYPEVNRIWFDDESDCIQLLKTGMQESKAGEVYPDIYYYLNAYLAHAGVDRYGRGSLYGDNPNAAHRVQAPIADPEMQDTTERQLEVSDSIATELRSALVTDRTILGSLEVLAGVNADAIPGMFEASREDISRREGAIIESAGQLVVAPLVYLPIGFRPSGREWSYMDATPTQEHPKGNYARELQSIKNGDNRSAVRELSREITELEKRVQFAERGRSMFSQLLAAELEQAR